MTATSDWLESEAMADVAFVLAIDGLGLAYTTHNDVTGLAAAWDDHDIAVKGGLKIQGAILRSIELFDAKIKPSSLTFQILDVESDLFPLMFGRGRTDIKRTRMVETATADATTISVADVTQIPGLETVYVGLETMITTAEDTDENTWTVERGAYSIFPRAGGTTWARTHTVPQESGAAAPEVTDAPTKWINRPVGLFVCHRVDGVWTAGLPGSSSNDAELLWAGRIKHYGDPGDGWLRLECAELTEMLMTSLATRVFEGTINEGSFFTEAQSWISVTIATIDPSVTIYRYTAELDISGTRVTHQQLANAINVAFSDAFVVNAGTYAPSGTGANLNLTTDPQTGEFRYQLNFILTGPASADLVQVGVFLSPKAWTMLGFTARYTDFTELGTPAIPGVAMAQVIVPRRVDSPTLYIAVASAAPRKLILDTVAEVSAVTASLASLIVTATTDVLFHPQGSVPASAPPDTNGFLRIMDRVFAVAQLDLDTFVILRELDELVHVVEGESEAATNRAILQFLQVPDTDGTPIKARQVWIEPDTLGRAMLRLLCSTGTEGYNIPLYDDMPATMGVGFPGSLIDIAAFLQQLGDLPYLIVLTEPTPFAKIFESALNVVGKHAVWSGG